MDTALPSNRWRWSVVLWVLLIGALAAASVGWRRAWTAEAALVRMRQDLGGLEAEAGQARDQVRRVEVLEAEIERLQRDTRELHRLRGQYQEWQQLKAEYEKLQRGHAALQQAKEAMAQSLQAATAAQQEDPQPREAWIGVTLDASFEEGAKVQSVVPGSPAATSDLVEDDVITAVDGQPVRNSNELRDAIAAKTAGEAVRIDLQRGGQVRRVILRTAPFPR